MVLINASHLAKSKPLPRHGKQCKSRPDSVVEIPALRRRRKSRENDLKMAMLHLKRGIPDKVVKEGSLFVQSKGLWRLPANFWKERYFVLNKDFLCFFKKGKDVAETQSPKEVIFLDGEVGIYTEEISSVHGRTNFCLKLTKRRRSYTLCASSEEERNSWLTALLTVVTENFLSQRPAYAPSTIPEESSSGDFVGVGHSEWNLSDVGHKRDEIDDIWSKRRASSAQVFGSSCDHNNNNGKLFKAFSMLNLGNHNDHRKSCVLFV